MPKVESHIYGEGLAKPGLMNLVSALNMQDHVKFHDFLPTDQIAGVMRESALAVEPKRELCLSEMRQPAPRFSSSSLWVFSQLCQRQECTCIAMNDPLVSV